MTTPVFHVDSSAIQRIRDVAEKKAIPKRFRISITNGGCSGFQYIFDFAQSITQEDIVFKQEDIEVVIDTVSLPFLENSTLTFTEDLMGAYFSIQNPNAQTSCGCGSSFSVG